MIRKTGFENQTNPDPNPGLSIAGKHYGRKESESLIQGPREPMETSMGIRKRVASQVHGG